MRVSADLFPQSFSCPPKWNNHRPQPCGCFPPQKVGELKSQPPRKVESYLNCSTVNFHLEQRPKSFIGQGEGGGTPKKQKCGRKTTPY